MSYVTKTFLLVSSLVSSKQLLCFVHGQGKKASKNIQQRTLSSFITISSISMEGGIWQSRVTTRGLGRAKVHKNFNKNIYL